MPKKKKVKVFVSYARANKKLARRFLGKFKEQVRPSLRYEYEFWDDNKILVGENWHESIQEALDNSQLGLLLISPAFLGSQYINEQELPRFVGQDTAKEILPIMLQPVDFDRHDLKGLKRAQIFRLDSENFSGPKAYGDCAGNQRDRFVQQLFLKVERKLDDLLS